MDRHVTPAKFSVFLTTPGDGHKHVQRVGARNTMEEVHQLIQGEARDTSFGGLVPSTQRKGFKYHIHEAVWTEVEVITI